MSDAMNPENPAASADTITDADFERLLDELHGDGAPQAVVDLGQAKEAPVLDTAQSSPDLISDDEFENLLDELHCTGGAPGQSTVQGETSNMEADASSDCVKLMLDPTMVIAQVSELHERLCSLVDESHTISIEGNEVNVIDTANLQLLYAFMRDRHARGHQTLIHQPSQAFVHSARSLGMLETLRIAPH